ncbi:hypothetical protein RB195_009415 [Necator americanus]|uniref:Uncharacterized protein n=1 Tax=Necator americanus TaxID=51031 RepID=A0ABR1CT87_NECAM
MNKKFAGIKNTPFLPLLHKSDAFTAKTDRWMGERCGKALSHARFVRKRQSLLCIGLVLFVCFNCRG